VLIVCNYENDRVGIDLPTIEVRFDHLKVEAEVHVGGRALPTFVNFISNFADVRMRFFYLSVSCVQTKTRSLTVEFSLILTEVPEYSASCSEPKEEVHYTQRRQRNRQAWQVNFQILFHHFKILESIFSYTCTC